MLNLSEIDPYAKQVVDFWADAEWFTCRLILPEIITVSVFKVSGETNTDDLPLLDILPRGPIFRCTLWQCWKQGCLGG